MTITSVVLVSATPDAPGACPDCACATDATGSAAMRNGIMNFINFIGSPRSVWLGSWVDRSCGSFEMTARTGEAGCRGFAGCGQRRITTSDRLGGPAAISRAVRALEELQ